MLRPTMCRLLWALLLTACGSDERGAADRDATDGDVQTADAADSDAPIDVTDPREVEAGDRDGGPEPVDAADADTSEADETREPPDVPDAPDMGDLADVTDIPEVSDGDGASDGDDPGDSDVTPPCPSLAHCAEVECAGDSATCARCEDGFADPGDGTCADIDDCAAAPCGLATCVDTGPDRYECHAGDAIGGVTGGTSILETPLGPFVATAGAGAFVDEAGEPIAGDVRFVVSPDDGGFTGTSLTADGRALAPEVIADLRFEDALGAPAHVAPGATVTVIMPLPRDTALTEDDALLVYTYDELAHTWIPETTGAVVRLDPFGASTPDEGGLGVSAALSHFTWYAAGGTCAAPLGCTVVDCDAATCGACREGYRLEGGACLDIDECADRPCGAGTCEDRVGGYACTCPAGTASADGTCVDLDDCEPNPCGVGTCTDTGPRAWTCACPDGFFEDRADGTSGCSTCPSITRCDAVVCTSRSDAVCRTCAFGYAPSGQTCAPIDECAGNTACAPGTCVDGLGTFTCDCPDGTFGDGTQACTPCDALGTCPRVVCTSRDDERCATCDAVVCTALDACHVPGTCDPMTGACSNPTGNEGAACDDGDVATHGDTCAAGLCVGTRVTCPANTPCTTWSPNGTASCTATPVTCDDGDLCTDDTCDPADGCVFTARTCDAGDACGGNLCNPTTGQCERAPFGDGTRCDDGVACTLVDRCVAGTCTGSDPCDDANDCTADACVEGVCQHTIVEGACDDGRACTTGDTCQGGVCVGAVPAECVDGNPCTSDACDDTGCLHVAIGGVCAPGDACALGTCVDGSCEVAGAVDCDDNNPCTDDRCDPQVGCINEPNTDACSDGSACTDGDTCQDGACVAGAQVDCDDDEACTFDVCDAIAGCQHFDLAGACNDGDACTAGDACESGACAGGVTIDCDDGNPCTDDRCDPQDGCVHDDNTATCSDGDACTSGDVCAAGACVPGAPVTCDDDDVCTVDECHPQSGCGFAPLTGSCDDGDACTGDGVCTNGECEGAAEISCDDEIACTDDTCDPATGCAHAPDDARCDDGNPCTDDTCDPTEGCLHTANTASCDDANSCTTGDQCADGACAGGPAPDCDDEDPCTSDACDPASGCTHVAAPPCDDDDACTVDRCEPASGCIFEAAPACNDDNPCTTDRCDTVAGCVYVPNNAACSDGDACTVGDRCAAGVCEPGSGAKCDDGNPCTDDTCDASGGCTHTANTAACDDGDPCTIGDVCAAKACTAGAPKTCTALDACHVAGTCDSQTGLCTNPFAEAGAACSDGDACTQTDTCDGAGHCVSGTPKVCPSATCVEAGPCDQSSGACAPWPSEAGTACEDGDLCTTGETCDGAGQCVNGQAVTCAALDACHLAGVCDGQTGLCSNPPADAGTPCDDGDACTSDETCDGAGTCGVIGGEKCNDGNPCTRDLCGPNGCEHPNDNTLPCDDGNVCTVNSCLAGACIVESTDVCNDFDVCTTDACDPTLGCTHTPNRAFIGNCSTGYPGLCGLGFEYCVPGGDPVCLPNADDIDVQQVVPVPVGLLEASTGQPVSGLRLITSDGRYLVSLSYGVDGVPYAGWSWRRFDPTRGFALVDEGAIEATSYFVDGVIADESFIYLHEWTGLDAPSRVSRINPTTYTLEEDIGTIPGNGPISGQYDGVNGRYWMGNLWAGLAYRWDGVPWDPASDNVAAQPALANVGGAGTLATDGVYLYVKRWALYPGDDWVRRIGTGDNGTVAGKYYGIIGTAPAPYGITAAYHADGYLYLPRHSAFEITRVRVSGANVETCNNFDDDCDGPIDEGCEALNDRCSLPWPLADGPNVVSLDHAAGVDGADACGLGTQADLWFQGNATCDGIVTVSTCGSDSGKVLSLIPGGDCALAEASPGICGRTTCGTGATASFEATQGESFFVRVGGEPGGSTTITVSCGDDTCGDAIVGASEDCDDGNFIAGDGCDPSCVREHCGDGKVQYGLGEICDAGDANSDTTPGACRTHCAPAGCGDGIVDPGEACDLGASNSDTQPDTCRNGCRLPACGDGVIDTGEACDDGDVQGEDGCSPLCVVEDCGDGVIQLDLGEECDDGGTSPNDGCGPSCKLETCGDGIKQAALGEQCDKGLGDATCDRDCKTRVCAPEQCNLVDDDCDGDVDEGCGLVVASQSLDGASFIAVVPSACQSEFDCNDQNVHTTDTCQSGKCVHTYIGCDGQDGDACLDGRHRSNGGPCEDTGPALLWDFDQAGAVELDASGNGYHGAFMGGAGAGTRVSGGRFGDALQLTGGGHVEVPFVMPETDFTISAWFKTSSPDGAIFSVVRARATASKPMESDREIYLKDGELAYEVKPGVTSRCVGVGEPIGYDDGAWHFVTLVCEANVSCRLLVDGVRACTSKVWHDRSGVTDPQAFFVGDSERGGPFTGLVDQVSVIEAALSDDEVAALMAGIDTPAKGRNLEVCNGVDDDCDGLVDESCDDGDLCTTGDTCSGTTCVAGGPVTCSSSAPSCKMNQCDPASGICLEVNAANGIACDDANACTHSEMCTAGVCGGGSAVHACNSDAAWFPARLLDESAQEIGRDKDVMVYRLNGELFCIYAIDPLKQYARWTEVPGAPGTWARSGLHMFGKASETQVANVYTCENIFPMAGTVTIGVGPNFSLGGTVKLPWPTAGFFKDIGLSPPPINVALPSFTLGLLPGAQLTHLFAPLRPDTRYWVLSGDLTVGIGPNGSPPIPLLAKQVTVVVDPGDPMFYVAWLGQQNIKQGLDKEFKVYAKTDYATGKVVDVRAAGLGFSLGGKLLHKSLRQIWTGGFVPGGGLELVDVHNDAHAYVLADAEITPFRHTTNDLSKFKIGLRGAVSFGFDPAKNGYNPGQAVVAVWNKIFEDEWDDSANDDLDFRLLMDADLSIILPPIPGITNPLTGGPIQPRLPLAGATLLIDTTPDNELVSFRARTTDFIDKLIKSIPGVPLVPYTPSIDLNGFVRRVSGVESWGVAADVSLPVGVVEFIGRLRVGSDGVVLDGLIEPGYIKLNPYFELAPFETHLELQGDRFCMTSPQSVDGQSEQSDGSMASTNCNVTLCIGKDGFEGSTFSCAPLCLGHSECTTPGQACIWGVCQQALANAAPCSDSGACASGRCYGGFCVECWPGSAECGGDEFCDNAGYCQDKLDLGELCLNVAGGDVMRNDWCKSGMCDTTCIECVAKSLIHLPPLNVPWTNTCGAGRFCGDEGICHAQRAGGSPCVSIKLAGPADEWCLSGDCGGPGTLCLECGPDTSNTCPSTHFCDPLKGGIVCSPKVADGTACGMDAACLSGHCGLAVDALTRCYTPRSKDYGASCLVADACKSGGCRVLDQTCGCNGKDSSCVNGWCEAVTDQCKPKKADGEACLTGVECLGGACTLDFRCYQPYSAPLGAPCLYDVECASNQCAGIPGDGNPGFCGCGGVDARCPAGQVCYDGVSCGTPVGLGVACTHDRLCTSGHCAGVCVQCTQHSDCGAGGWCAADFTCKPKASDGTACLTDVECAGGHCSQLTGCYTPYSVATGAACGADLQCQSGQCVQAIPNTIGYCGCAGQSWRCGGGNVCYNGIDCGTPQPNGGACLGYDALCQSGHCFAGLCGQCSQDGHCGANHVCVSGACVFVPTCGDGQCNGGETCVTCPADCGGCWSAPCTHGCSLGTTCKNHPYACGCGFKCGCIGSFCPVYCCPDTCDDYWCDW